MGARHTKLVELPPSASSTTAAQIPEEPTERNSLPAQSSQSPSTSTRWAFGAQTANRIPAAVC